MHLPTKVGTSQSLHVYYGIKVNEIQKQHAVAIDLLARLGLDTIKLEAEGNGQYRYHAWAVPRIASNGSPRTRHGVIRQRVR
jgi:hypothetical protein